MPFTTGSPRLHFDVRGAGAPLLVITGFGLPSALLEPMLSAGGDRLRWITYDHPGVGLSDGACRARLRARKTRGNRRSARRLGRPSSALIPRIPLRADQDHPAVDC